MRALIVLIPLFLFSHDLLASEVRGRVTDRQGRTLEQAKVTATGTETTVFTSRDGAFSIDCEVPCTLLVEHPRFRAEAVDVIVADGLVEIELASKQQVYEEILVTASRGTGDRYAPESVAATIVSMDEETITPSTLLDVVDSVPGVAENGQGGLFQVFSIRGVSRLRVMSLIDGMQIVGERRAGVSTSFVDPLLMDGVEVLRGPSSTYYGSGALGGVVQVFPRVYHGLRVETGWDSFADENYQSLGWGDDDWSFAFAHRTRGNDTAADGTPLNERFDQYSATLARRWQGDGKTYEFLAIPTLGVDIGKSSSEFPDVRIVEYPQETHLLLRFGLDSDQGWRFSTWVHPNNLRTETLSPGETFNVVRNRAFDLGANFQRDVDLSKKVSGRFGLDYFGRRGVEAQETEEELANGALFDSRTLDGERDDLATYGSVRFQWGPASVQTGARFTFHQEDNSGFDRRDDTALVGFLGLVLPLGKGFELSSNLGTGLRFPSLSERFFTGTTGRGSVIGNPDLEAEESLSSDLGIAFFGRRAFVSAKVFRLSINDYIERVRVTSDVRTFVNLTAGTITGFELDGFYQIADAWRFDWNGHLIDGEEDGTDVPLADIPPDRFQIGLQWSEGRWSSRLAWQYRADKDNPGSGERPIPDVHLVSLGLEYQLTDDLRLRLRGRNLLDEVYYSSADDAGPVAPGRSIGLGLTWQP